MSIIINITIEGQHATDALAELKSLAEALDKSTATKVSSSEIKILEDNEMIIDDPLCPNNKKSIKTSKKYSAKDQKEIADNMIADGVIDEEVFADLNKTQQERIKKAGLDISTKKSDNNSEKLEELDFFDEEEVVKKITLDELKTLIEKVCKGNAENYNKVRTETQKLIPAGKEIKFVNIPEDKLSIIYDFVSKLNVDKE